MARKTTRRAAPRAAKPLQPRDLVLAGIGAVSLGRKQVIQTYANGFEGVTDLRARTEKAVKACAKSVNGKVASLEKQVKAKVGPLQKKLAAVAIEAQAQAETRLAPVLAKLGIKKAPARRAAGKKKVVAKRPAKRATPRRRRAA